jgi:hypothetical protein
MSCTSRYALQGHQSTASTERSPQSDGILFLQYGIQALVDGRDTALDFSLQLLSYLSADNETQARVRAMFSPCCRTCPDRQVIASSENQDCGVVGSINTNDTMGCQCQELIRCTFHMCSLAVYHGGHFLYM